MTQPKCFLPWALIVPFPSGHMITVAGAVFPLGKDRMSQTFLTWNGNGKSLEPPILRYTMDFNSNPRNGKILRIMLEGFHWNLRLEQ